MTHVPKLKDEAETDDNIAPFRENNNHVIFVGAKLESEIPGRILLQFTSGFIAIRTMRLITVSFKTIPPTISKKLLIWCMNFYSGICPFIICNVRSLFEEDINDNKK